MFALPLADSAVLRPLEPWQAEEFLAHLDRAREHIVPWVSPSFVARDVGEARAVLQRYADKRAQDGGGIWGIWLDGLLVGGVMFVSFDTALGVCEAGCWLEPGAQGRGLITRAARADHRLGRRRTRHCPRRVAYQLAQRAQHRGRAAAGNEPRRNAASGLPERRGRTD